MNPTARVRAYVAEHGLEPFARGCVAILDGDAPDPELLSVLRGDAGGGGWWHDVWALRGLRWAWHPLATDALRDACRHEAWRVREMACKAVAHNLLDGAFEDVVALRGDPQWRVRAAAERAVVRLTARSAPTR